MFYLALKVWGKTVKTKSNGTMHKYRRLCFKLNSTGALRMRGRNYIDVKNYL